MTKRKSCDGGYEREGVGKKYKEETRNPHGNPKEEEGKGICQPNSNLYKKHKAPQATMIKIIGTMKKTSRTQYGLKSKIATKEKKDAAGIEFSPNIFTS